MFLGRRDSQIKRSGYRIELGEIETALCAAGVALGCCYYDADREKIVAAFTGDVDIKELKNALKAALPKYMLPDTAAPGNAAPHRQRKDRPSGPSAGG